MREQLKYVKTLDYCVHPWQVDTYYGGCRSECKFCYAKGLLDFSGNWNPESVKAADWFPLARKIRKTLKEGDVVHIGTFTDNFQPIEREYHHTEYLVDLLNDLGVHYIIASKFVDVASERMMRLYDRRLAHFHISLTSTNDEFCRTYEKASLPSERIKVIETFQQEAFDTTIRLSPLVVDFIDNGMLDLDVFNAIRCDKVLVEFLRVNRFIKKWFADYTDLSQYTYEYRHYWHLPLETKEKYLNILLKDSKREFTMAERVAEHDAVLRERYYTNKEDCCNIRLT